MYSHVGVPIISAHKMRNSAHFGFHVWPSCRITTTRYPARVPESGSGFQCSSRVRPLEGAECRVEELFGGWLELPVI